MSFLNELKSMKRIECSKQELLNIQKKANQIIAEQIYEELKNDIIEKVRNINSKSIVGYFKVNNLHYGNVDWENGESAKYAFDEQFVGSTVYNRSTLTIHKRFDSPVSNIESIKTEFENLEMKKCYSYNGDYWDLSYNVPINSVLVESGLLMKKYTLMLSADSVIESVARIVGKMAKNDGFKISWGAMYRKYSGKTEDGSKKFDSNQFVEDGFVFSNAKDGLDCFYIKYEVLL